MKLFKVKKVIEFYTYAEDEDSVDVFDYEEDGSTVDTNVVEVQHISWVPDTWRKATPFGEDYDERTIKEFFTLKEFFDKQTG